MQLRITTIQLRQCHMNRLIASASLELILSAWSKDLALRSHSTRSL